MKFFTPEDGGKCSCCQEEDNWTLIDAFLTDEGGQQVLLKCFTRRYGEDDGAFMYECGNIIELVDGVKI